MACKRSPRRKGTGTVARTRRAKNPPRPSCFWEQSAQVASSEVRITVSRDTLGGAGDRTLWNAPRGHLVTMLKTKDLARPILYWPQIERPVGLPLTKIW